MNYLVLFTVLVLSSCAYVADSWLYPGFGLGYGLGGFYGGLGGFYGGYGLGFRGLGWPYWGKRDAEFIPRVDCIFKREKNTLVCNGVECETIDVSEELRLQYSKYSMFGIGRDTVGASPIKYKLYPKSLTSVVFSDSEHLDRSNRLSSIYLFSNVESRDECGLGVKSQECFNKFVSLFNLVKNDFKDKMISFKNETVDISLYGSIVVE